MNQSDLPATAFIAPNETNKTRIETFVARALKSVVSIIASSEQRPATPHTVAIPENPIPEASIGDDKLLDLLKSMLLESVNPSHPGWVPHMDPPPATASLIGDFAAAAINNNMLSIELSPALSQLEQQVVEHICRLFGLGTDASGILCSGGSLANLQALTVARNVHFNAALQGMQPLPEQPVLFASEVAHTSLQKAAMILGLGNNSVRPVAVDAQSKMKPNALKESINRAKKEGVRPFCVVATAGTTTTGTIDPLKQVGTIAAEENLWYHVDAAYGGALVFSDTHKHQLGGISGADSITFNPQKWLYVAKTCAMVLFKDRQQLVDHFRTSMPYMNGDDNRINLGELSIQGTRHADVLKLWTCFQHMGRVGLQQLIDESYRLTHRLQQQLQQIPTIKLASNPEMNIICFRGCPASLPATKWDEWNSGLQQYLLNECQLVVSLPTYANNKWLRTVILNPFVNEKIIDKMPQGIVAYINSTR